MPYSLQMRFPLHPVNRVKVRYVVRLELQNDRWIMVEKQLSKDTAARS